MPPLFYPTMRRMSPVPAGHPGRSEPSYLALGHSHSSLRCSVLSSHICLSPSHGGQRVAHSWRRREDITGFLSRPKRYVFWSQKIACESKNYNMTLYNTCYYVVCECDLGYESFFYLNSVWNKCEVSLQGL